MEEPSRKRRREDEGGGWEESEERVPKKFRVVMRDVAAGPVRMEASVAEEAVSLWRAAKPSEAEKRKEADLLAHLKRIAVKWMHKATVNLYSPALATYVVSCISKHFQTTHSTATLKSRILKRTFISKT
ncbi:hypothetical protein DIPPA_17730 [Diplonema papillatum]|nr:hypothetical protein DIPPA_17730 [Diplonema papillatum]